MGQYPSHSTNRKGDETLSKILCIIDGMTDPEFNLSQYPHLSGLYQLGEVDTCRGSAPESLGCILRLLGTKEVPERFRGYVEALGCGIPVGEDDLILRGSWYRVDERGYCVAPVAGESRLPVGEEVCRYYPMGQYKRLLVFPGMAGAVTEICTQSPYRCAGRPAEMMKPVGLPALERLFDWCLGAGKCLIPWGESVPAKIPAFPERGCVVCGTEIVRGIARLLDMTLVVPAGCTGDTDTDLMAKVQATLQAAEEYPFVLLHLNGADEASHRRDRREKQAFLKKVDALVLPPLLRPGHGVWVVADHGTDPGTGAHLGEKQPRYGNRPEWFW